MKTLLTLLLLIPSLSWGLVHQDEEIIIKCEPDWYFDVVENKEVEIPVQSRIIQIDLFEPNTNQIEVQYTNSRRWEGNYTSDNFYASYNDEKHRDLVIDFMIKINRLTGEYVLNRYVYIKREDKNYAWVESGSCKKSSKLF